MIIKESDYENDVSYESSVTTVNTSEKRGEEWRSGMMDIGYEVTKCLVIVSRSEKRGEKQRSWTNEPGHSVVVSRGGRVRRREWNAFARFVWDAVIHSLLLHGLWREGRECVENRIPMLLIKVVGDIIHEPCGRWAPGVAVELLARGNEISSSVHFVCTFNLARDHVRAAALEKSDATYCSGHKGKDTQWLVSNSWVFVWDKFHDTG